MVTLVVLFIIYLIALLVFVIYLVVVEFYNKRVRQTINNNTDTSIFSIDELKRIKCNEHKVYCIKDDDCLQICSRPLDEMLQSEYKCNEFNVCTQSVLTNEENDNPEDLNCKRNFGFYPVLTADEIFSPYWICLNTRPYIFTNQQQYHPYICGGSDQLDPDNLFDSCQCPDNKIKVRDEFRSTIPICIDQNQLPLFPNLTSSLE